jgi:hypothetical protein
MAPVGVSLSPHDEDRAAGTGTAAHADTRIADSSRIVVWGVDANLDSPDRLVGSASATPGLTTSERNTVSTPHRQRDHWRDAAETTRSSLPG